MALEDDIRRLIADAADTAGPAVVTVGRGCGVVVGDGRVVTNAHNVAPDVVVAFADGRRAPAELLGIDPGGDLAVLAADTADVVPAELATAPPRLGVPGGDLAVLAADTADVTPAELATAPPRLGDPVVALARPHLRGLVATLGTVTATGVRFRGPHGTPIRDAVEHDARMPRGASGGPAVDAAGRIVAINTHRRRDGFYAALPVTGTLRERIDGLARGERAGPPRLGIAVAPPPVARRLRDAVGLDDRPGVLVREVDPDGPAARAGLTTGDLLTAVDGTPIDDIDVLHDRLAAADGRLRLTVVRGAEEREVVVDPASGDTTGTA